MNFEKTTLETCVSFNYFFSSNKKKHTPSFFVVMPHTGRTSRARGAQRPSSRRTSPSAHHHRGSRLHRRSSRSRASPLGGGFTLWGSAPAASTSIKDTVGKAIMGDAYDTIPEGTLTKVLALTGVTGLTVWQLKKTLKHWPKLPFSMFNINKLSQFSDFGELVNKAISGKQLTSQEVTDKLSRHGRTMADLCDLLRATDIQILRLVFVNSGKMTDRELTDFIAKAKEYARARDSRRFW